MVSEVCCTTRSIADARGRGSATYQRNGKPRGKRGRKCLDFLRRNVEAGEAKGDGTLKVGLLILSAGLLGGQTISQKTEGLCSPAVITSGNVVITCNGVKTEDLEKVQKGVAILNSILKQKDAAILSKLDGILALLTPLRDQVDTQRKELTAIQQFSEVSKLNILGTKLPPNGDVVDETDISRILKGAFLIHDGDGARVLCTPDAMRKFHSVIDSHPNFPFSYYAIAYCLGRQGDAEWKNYAKNAVEIFKITTTIDGHHPNHDFFLRELTLAIGQ